MNQAILTTGSAPRGRLAYFWQLNGFIILAIACNLINCIYYFIDGMPHSALVNLVGIFILGLCAVANLNQWFELSRLLSVLIVNIHGLLLCYIQGIGAGSYLYLFPFVVALIFLLRTRKNNRQLYTYTGMTIANLLGILFIIPYRTAAEGATDSVYYNHLVLNISLNFLLLIIFFISVLQLLDRKERRIKRFNRFTETLFETSLDAVIVVDPVSKQVKQYNRKAAQFFYLAAFNRNLPSYAADQVLGEKMMARIREVALDPDRNWQGDISFERRGHSSFHGYVSLVAFESDEQYFVKISILDISNVKSAEFETLRAKEKAEQAAAAKTRFMSNMSHELRTPLNAIIGTTNILLSDEQLTRNNEHFSTLKQSSEHMLQLVNSVLDFGKLDAGKLLLSKNPFNVYELLQQISASFQTELPQKPIRFTLLADSLKELPPVMGDELRLRQVLLNLFSNALKFTEKGMIELEASVIRKTSTEVRLYFAVIDTGIGIEPGKIPVIFDSFTQADAATTRKYGGSGLGLSICNQLVQQMGGELRVKSQPEGGSCFYFSITLPVTQGSLDTAVPSKLKELPSLEGYRILLAEDNAINSRIAQRFLRGWGAEVMAAENGLIAWEAFQQYHFDILVIDLEMPEMDGKQLLKNIRERNPKIAAIAFTAAVYENMAEDLATHGFTDFLHKPFKPADLHQKIWNFLPPKSEPAALNEES